MASTIYANNVAGTLGANIGPSDTLVLLGAGQGASFPSPTGGNYYYITVVHLVSGAVEVMQVTGRSVDTLTVVRGRDNTTAISLVTGSVVEMRVCAQLLREADWRTSAGVAKGVATLDAGGKLSPGQIPDSVLTETEAIATYIPLTQKGAASGVATLDAGTKIPVAQIPALAYLPTGGGTLTGTLTINSAGLNVGGDINATRPAQPLTGVIFFGNQSGGARYLYYDGTNYNLGAAALVVGGNLFASDFIITSDRSLKKDISYYEPDPKLADKIMLAAWNWIANGMPSRGVVADDLEAIAPHLVRIGEDGIRRIDKAQVALESVAGLAKRVQHLELAHAA